MRFENKILIGFGLVVIIIIFLGVYSFNNNKEYIITNRWVIHTNEVLYNVERTNVAMLDIVVGQRGFELSGDEAFLEPYNRGSEVIFDYIKKLRYLVKDNATQVKKLDTLVRLIYARTQFSKERIDAKRSLMQQHQLSFNNSRHIDAALPAERDDARSLMEEIRIVITSFQQQEKILLDNRIAANEKQTAEFTNAFTTLLVSMLVLLTLVFMVIGVNQKARNKAEAKLQGTQALLSAMIESQKEVAILSIDKNYRYLIFNKAHREAMRKGYGIDISVGMNLLSIIPKEKDKAVAKANYERALSGESHINIAESEGLDDFFEVRYNPIIDTNGAIIGAVSWSTNITERKNAEQHLLKVTEELSIANEELEAFSYSVSHDLRAPLRSINGYSRILLEDYAEKLDEEGRKVLSTVINNAGKMGTLIDDLLNFSRIGRTGLSQNNLEMDYIAKEIVREQITGKEDKIDVHLLPLSHAVGDTGMIRQVWTNLISNAIKYSSKKVKQVIEIGSRPENGMVTFYVKDNGVGFDMQYAHKLFGVFQRLHRSSDFEGTGVGLAIVSRIINRHGGKVWAESTPTEGATFYFSLPQKT